MKTFMQWLAEDNGQVSGNYENDELLQAVVNSKYLAVVNTKKKVPKSAECNYLGICPKGKKVKVNLLPVEV